MTKHQQLSVTAKSRVVRHALALALVVAVNAYAQQTELNQPPETSPKTPSYRTQPSQLLNRMLQEQTETSGDDTIITPRLRGVIIVKTRDEIELSGAAPMRGLDVRGIPFLNETDFQDAVSAYLDRELTVGKLKLLQRDIILYCRSRNRPLVDVILPEQTVENGVIQLWFLEGKVGQVSVQRTGKEWFSDKSIVGQVHLQPGDSVDSQRLLADLDWINRNPFRQVDAEFKQGARLGQSDVVLLSQERLPLRLYAGYEDSGTKLTGVNRLLGGFNWGNAFGLDHQLSYQYMTDTDFEFVKANSASYLIPLPWHHSLTFFGSYVDAKADVSPLSPSFNQRGTDYQVSFRYDVPLPASGNYHHEVTAGYDLKVSDNNLLFGGAQVVNTDTAVNQFELGYRGLLSDGLGQTSFGLETYLSPALLTPNNTDSAFEQLRSGASANYIYVRHTVERDTRLPKDFSWILRITGQFSSNRLIPSEELGVGGYDTVRGYDERTASGDEGWIISNELRTPPISLLRFAPQSWQTQLKLGSGATDASSDRLATYPDQMQFLTFLDYGTAHILNPEVGEDQNIDLASAGVGLRYVISRYLSVRLDYGWKLKPNKDTDSSTGPSRGDVAVLLSY
jgi:hemolysin activation/secretion protein